MKFALMLCSLPESYNSLITALEVHPIADLTYSIVKNAIIGESKRRESQLKTGENGETALKVNRNNNGDIVCYFCHRIGHIKSNCPRYLKWKNKVNRMRANAAQALTDDSEDSESESLLNFAFIAHRHTKQNTWYFHSGASKHMTNDVNFYLKLDSNYRSSVRVANKQISKVYGVGSGKIKCLNSQGQEQNLNLNNVLFVPDFDSSLISINMLDKDGFKISVEDGKMKIVKNNSEVAVGDALEGMYELRPISNVMIARDLHKENCIHQWHKRLAHRDPDAIRRLERNNLAHGINISDCPVKSHCESCIKGKMSRSAFPKQSNHITTSPRQLVHTDICGPMPIQTPGGLRYVITFVDDFSRRCQLFLISRKSKANNIIKKYVNNCETQFGQVPKIFRSDRGGEYSSHKLKNFFKKQGIQQQLTAPYSPQQNGIAERKNRYLVEAMRTTLIEVDLPKTYWGEAITTACYLQNRLPTKDKDKTPFELWHGVKPNLSHVKIFGCKAFAHVPKERRKKLDSKAQMYTFIGYSQESNGYRLLDRKSGKVIISRDVRFFEDEKDTHQNEILARELQEEEEVEIPEKLLINKTETEISETGHEISTSFND